MELFFKIILFAYTVSTVSYGYYFLYQKKQAQRTARVVLLSAVVAHTVYLIGQYLERGHVPVVSVHGAVSFYGWALAFAFVFLYSRYKTKNLGVFVAPLITITMFVAFLSPRETIDLPPVLQTYWLPVHAITALLANAFLTLSFCGGIMYLLQEREIKNKRFGIFYSRLPSLEALDNFIQQALIIAFPLLTLGIIAGSLWAKQIAGVYWQWGHKEVWSLITWLIYAAILHLRFTLGWRRQRVAIMAIVGFVAVILTLFGVIYLREGLNFYVR